MAGLRGPRYPCCSVNWKATEARGDLRRHLGRLGPLVRGRPATPGSLLDRNPRFEPSARVRDLDTPARPRGDGIARRGRAGGDRSHLVAGAGSPRIGPRPRPVPGIRTHTRRATPRLMPVSSGTGASASNSPATIIEWRTPPVPSASRCGICPDPHRPPVRGWYTNSLWFKNVRGLVSGRPTSSATRRASRRSSRHQNTSIGSPRSIAIVTPFTHGGHP